MKQVPVIAAVIALGVAVEAAAPSSTGAIAAADLMVGVGLACAGATQLQRAPRCALLAVATAVAWFLGTLAGASAPALSAIGSVCLLAYRGPLLHLLLATPSGRLGDRRTQALAGAAWIACLLPLQLARPATAASAALSAGCVALEARRAATDRRRPLAAASLSALILAGIWTVPLVTSGGRWLLMLDDLAVLVAGVIGVSAGAAIWSRRAASGLMLALRPAEHPGRPVTAQLARALADPALELRYAVPGIGWTDERGRPVDPPADDGRAVTRATAHEGGEVALVHGPDAVADPRLAQAAAAAAVLVVDAARLEAETRARAAEVRASRRRLVTTADDERRALEQRLSDTVLTRLRRVDRLLTAHSEASATALRTELHASTAELAALGRGLYPPALVRTSLGGALTELAARSTVPTSARVHGDPERLTEGQRAAVWFICSEALANIAQHADASHATLTLHAGADEIALEITDDGRGGATLSRGLRGLADRVQTLSGTFQVISPPGGPTHLRANLPA